MNTQTNEKKMPNNFKYPNRCRLIWNVKLQKNEWVQYLGAGHDCVPELVDTSTTKITDLSIDILRMINQNTKYIRNKKRLNLELNTAFRQLSINMGWMDGDWTYAIWNMGYDNAVNVFVEAIEHFKNTTYEYTILDISQ